MINFKQASRQQLTTPPPWEDRPGDPEVAKENEETLRVASEKLGITLEPGDRLITVAHKLKNLARS
jgi:hypothetical protein